MKRNYLLLIVGLLSLGLAIPSFGGVINCGYVEYLHPPKPPANSDFYEFFKVELTPTHEGGFEYRCVFLRKKEDGYIAFPRTEYYLPREAGGEPIREVRIDGRTLRPWLPSDSTGRNVLWCAASIDLCQWHTLESR